MKQQLNRIHQNSDVELLTQVEETITLRLWCSSGSSHMTLSADETHCRLCQEEEETTLHVLCECETFAGLR